MDFFQIFGIGTSIKIKSVQIPTALHEALKDKNWNHAMEEEMNALNKNQTWEIVGLPKGKQSTSVYCET